MTNHEATEKHAPYARAVELFASLVTAPVDGHCRKPADLTRSLGRAPATAFRVVREAEASGLVQRDMHQSYRRGLVAHRIGFSALGFGDLADVAEPVLMDLREKTRLTSLIAFACDHTLKTGPFSLGRGPEFLRPARSYVMGDVLPPTKGVAMRLQPDNNKGPSPHFRAVVVRRSGALTCLLGVISGADLRDRVVAIDETLARYPGRLSPEVGANP